MSFLEQRQRAMGNISRVDTRVRGAKYDYRCIIDHTVDPKTTLLFSGIYMRPTAEARQMERQQGLLIETPSQNGNRGTEKNQFFLISRETLKADGVMTDSLGATPVAGTRYAPQIGDEFNVTGDSVNYYYVAMVMPEAALPGYWQLQFTRHIRRTAAGVSNG